MCECELLLLALESSAKQFECPTTTTTTRLDDTQTSARDLKETLRREREEKCPAAAEANT